MNCYFCLVLYLTCGEGNVKLLFVLYCTVNIYVCVACYMSDRVSELFCWYCVIKTILFNNFYDFYNKLIKTDLRLVDERCVTLFIGNLQREITDIDKYFYFF